LALSGAQNRDLSTGCPSFLFLLFYFYARKHLFLNQNQTQKEGIAGLEEGIAGQKEGIAGLEEGIAGQNGPSTYRGVDKGRTFL
jgi:hypothetical protein